MADYHQTNDEANKAILQKLVDDCQDLETATVIRCYTIGAKGADIRKELIKHKVPPLKKCALHLGIYPEGDTKKLKCDIITDIMTRLNSLLKDLCGICGEYFHNELQEKPLFSCLICHQGCHRSCFEPIHTLFNALDENQRKSMQFICTSCHSDHIDDDVEITVNAPKVKKSPSKTNPPTILDPEEDNQEDNQHDQTNNEHPEDTPGSPRTNEGLVNGDSDGDSENVTSKDTTEISICPAYKWGRCTNYENCQYRHPPRCWSWLSNGKCSFRKKCRYHHPPLCHHSLWEKQCFNAECKYFHLTKTVRYKIEDEQLKNSLKPSNYHAQYPQLPHAQYSQAPLQPPYQATNIPLQPTSFHAQPPQQSNVGPQNRQHQPSPQNQPPQQSRSSFSQSDVSFLAKTIKEAIKDDLAVEISNMRRDLSMQIQNASRQHIMPTPNMPQVQMAPIMFSHPIPGITK